MSIPKLKKIKSEKKYHNITLSDEYAWVDQPNILEVLKDANKLDPKVKNYISANNKVTKDFFQDVKDLENAGAACVEVEVVPVELADFITRNTKMITMGMGCGNVCDTQYLFCNDILGTNEGHYPRHAKKYVDLKKEENEIQNLRLKGFQMFVDDMNSGKYPEEKHQINMDLNEFEKFQNKIK